MVEITEMVNGLTLRSAIPGGVQQISFNIADDYIGAYRRAYDHIGTKIYVFDNATSPPVAEGVILEPSISEGGNRVIAAGPWQAYCFSQVYNNTATWVAAGTTGAQIKAVLTTECPGINTDLTYVAEPGTSNFPWQPSDNSYPGDLIEFLMSLSDASNREWYFWIQSAPMYGTAAKAPIAWFQHANEVPGSFICWRENMSPGGLELTPSLRELANDVRVIYRDASGAQNQTASAVDADSQARYGLRERWDYDLGQAPATAANQYRNLLLAKYKDPQQSVSFRLNSWVYDDYGGKWPLWRLIADFPCRFSVVDLVPDTLHTPSLWLDNQRTFMTLAAEYSYDSNMLSVVPDTEDNRADAMLARHRAFQ